MHRHHAKRVLLVKRTKLQGSQVDCQELQKFFSFFIRFAMAPRPKVRYLWDPWGSLGGFVFLLIVNNVNTGNKSKNAPGFMVAI